MSSLLETASNYAARHYALAKDAHFRGRLQLFYFHARMASVAQKTASDILAKALGKVEDSSSPISSAASRTESVDQTKNQERQTE